MVWILLLVVYEAPADAVDWNGPWKAGTTTAVDRRFQSEAECRNTAIEMIGKLHQGMLAPVRYQCVEFPADLPKGAPR
ncbi:MAG TPA: hypothetical protein VFW19_13770 [Allosphingosinicella sp.]|nr:hypothetical protein [Allosphingosinicella sp.]